MTMTLVQRDNYYFGGNREVTILRDKEQCVKCGMTRAEHRVRFGRDITVDHINGNGPYDRRSKVPNNSLDNLQTLCTPCHSKKDSAKTKRILTDEDVSDIRMFARHGITYADMTKVYKVHRYHIGAIVRGIKRANTYNPSLRPSKDVRLTRIKGDSKNG